MPAPSADERLRRLLALVPWVAAREGPTVEEVCARFGMTEADAETAVGAKVLWRVPNQYFAISSAIDRGTPVMDQRNSEIARCFSGLAQELTRNDADVKRAAWSLFKSV